MPKTSKFDLSGPSHIVEPPIIDFLAHDAQLEKFIAEFVPDSKVSSELKEAVQIEDKSQTARRIGELLEELAVTLKISPRIVKVAHVGGGDFDLYTVDGSAYHLHESPSPQVSFDAYAILQVLSHEVQLEFITKRKQLQRAAS